ncbi:MAG: ComEC family competence protein [Chlorobi bacterium]|nr:ComEC family competence protein [Chlorobiota bacterium]
MPAWKTAVCFGLGIVLAAQITIPVVILFPILVLLWGILLYARRNEQMSTALVLAALITAGSLYYQIHREPVPTALSRLADTRQKTTLLCTVESSPVQRKKGFSLFGNVIRAWNDSGIVTNAGPVYIRWYPGFRIKHATVPSYGDTLLLTGRLRTARGARNPGEFDFRKYLERHGTVYRFSVSGKGLRGHHPYHGFSVNRALNLLRNGIKNWIGRFYPKDTAPILSALLLGLRNELDPEINEAFISTGVIHVLAVSGLHVGMILVIIWVLLSRATERVRILITMPLLLFYALLCGAAPPVLRATVIAELYLLGRLLSRLSDSINLLGVAALLNLVLRPDDILYASFHLSYAAVLGIILIYPVLRAALASRWSRIYEKKLPGYIADLLLVSIAASISTLPFVLLHFGRFSLVGIMANIVVVPGVWRAACHRYCSD